MCVKMKEHLRFPVKIKNNGREKHQSEFVCVRLLQTVVHMSMHLHCIYFKNSMSGALDLNSQVCRRTLCVCVCVWGGG